MNRPSRLFTSAFVFAALLAPPLAAADTYTRHHLVMNDLRAAELAAWDTCAEFADERCLVTAAGAVAAGERAAVEVHASGPAHERIARALATLDEEPDGPSDCVDSRSFEVHLAAAPTPRLAAQGNGTSETAASGSAVVRAGRGGARVRFAAGDRDYRLTFSVSCSADDGTVRIQALELSLMPDSDRGLAGEDLVATNFEMPVGQPVTVSSLSGANPLTLVIAAR
jgi:hypothetical protein